ncbi:hypothetical protein [Streptomyces sp. C1-2]|uniref:hypothetical protein n=1 Tax=Streptomyces sp. C1-2 TaxID=2720022 RepID=UPI0014324F59|nr:hypothetical protein [Streptomyces sp. C1-2]NJP74327.1 hypothetical protein [Streptomyces sp. C1-2]
MARVSKTSRTYFGVTVTGDPSRFRRAKTTSARRADRQGQAWEDADRQAERRGGWRRTTW